METLLVMSCGCKLTKNEVKRYRINNLDNYVVICPKCCGIAVSKICFCQYPGCGKPIPKKKLNGGDRKWCDEHLKKIKNINQKIKYRPKYEKSGKRPERHSFKKINDRACYCKIGCHEKNCDTCNSFVPLFGKYDPAKMSLLNVN